ncbi:hypothetical protein GGI00_006277, partial [Coemansia sp. RSA 2681]
PKDNQQLKAKQQLKGRQQRLRGGRTRVRQVGQVGAALGVPDSHWREVERRRRHGRRGQPHRHQRERVVLEHDHADGRQLPQRRMARGAGRGGAGSGGGNRCAGV